MSLGVSWSKKVSRGEGDVQLGADCDISFNCLDRAYFRVVVSANTENIGSAISQGFTPRMVEQQTVILRETQDFAFELGQGPNLDQH